MLEPKKFEKSDISARETISYVFEPQTLAEEVLISEEEKSSVKSDLKTPEGSPRPAAPEEPHVEERVVHYIREGFWRREDSFDDNLYELMLLYTNVVNTGRELENWSVPIIKIPGISEEISQVA